MLGTMNQLRATAPVDTAAPVVVAGGVIQRGRSTVSRIRMITYYVNTTADPTSPRLVRQINGNPPNAVAFEMEAFRITYDLADGVANPVGVRMDATDLGVGGACGAVGLLAEPDPQGQRGDGDPVGAAQQGSRLPAQHAVHADRDAQSVVRGPVPMIEREPRAVARVRRPPGGAGRSA